VSPADRRVIALGNLVGELKTSLEEATSSAGVALVLTREPAKALIELEKASAVAVLVDMATLGAEQFCKRARGTERLRGVPIIGMSRTPSELGFARVFGWGADDLVPLGATPALARRLAALVAASPHEQASFGQAVVAEGTTQRRALLGRVLVHAGYDVKFAVDRGSVELYASQAETRIVVISATLGDPRKLIESASRAGGLATWIVTAEARSVARLASGLAGLERVVVTSTAGSPEDILFLANEIVFGPKGHRQREWRALYGTPVAFRPMGATTDDYGFSYDASPGGLYVRSLLPCESDDVEVELRPPERDERVRLLGKVVRRFAFGSGSVASAPPGFGVKVTGPKSPALKLWVEACRAYVEKVGSGSPPEAAPPVNEQSPKGADSSSSLPALAVPGPNLTIESVIAPLPNERTDVAGLLSETLGEEAPPEAGTRPVTVDLDTGGVREERPSEYGMSPVPDSVPPEAEAVTLKPAPEQARPPSTRPPLPVPIAPRDDHDDETAVYERSEVEAFAAKQDKEAAAREMPKSEPKAAPAPVAAPPMVAAPPLAKPIGPPPVRSRTPAAGMPAAMAPGAAPAPPAPAPPGAQPPPPLAPSAAALPFAGTMIAPPRAPAGLGGTVVLPPPGAGPVAPEPKAPEPAPAASPPAQGDGLSGAYDASHLLESVPPEAGDAPTMPAPPSSAEPALPAMPAVPAAAPFAYGTPSVQATSRGFPAHAPPAESLPRNFRPADVHEEVPVPSIPKKSGGSGVVLAVIAVVALAVGVGGGLFLVQRAKQKTAPPEPAPTAEASETAAPANTEVVPTPQESAAPAPSATPEPSTAPAAAESAPAPAASEAPATPPKEVPPPSFDLTKLPGDRAALLVRSSVTARVFVHGKDYGETNQYLLTSCGIRFVRIGTGLNQFLEPGRSLVVKCGKTTEVSIEPGR
jgi:hypothetical protein